MRLKSLAAGALFGFCAIGMAQAQSNGQLKPGQVWGNAGTTQAPASPMYVPSATARMSPNPGQSTSPTVPWSAVDPWGNPINCAGTTTQCLQEFITATASNGWPARVYCQGTKFPSGTEPVYINTSSAISVPVAQDWDFEADGTCNLNINVTTTSGLILDSQGASRFIWDGKIVYNVTSPNGNTATSPSCAVLLNPTNPTQDGFAAIYAGLVRIKSPVVVTTGGAIASGVICINTNAGQVIQQTLEFQEINANNVAYKGILIANASATTGFQQNHIYANQVHGAVSKSIDEGFSATNQANYNSNIWVVSNIESNGATSRGVDTWGSYDTWQIGTINNVQGGLQYGILTETGANNNQMQYGLITGATTAAVLDSGTCNSIIGAQGGTLALAGTTSGCTKIKPAAVASGSIIFPAGTTDFSATGGASQFVKQASAGAPFTVVQPAITDLSGLGTGVATALGVNVGTAGSFVVNGGALGSPSSVGTMPAFTMGGAIAMGGFAITGGGAITGASHIPSGSSIPTNGMYLPTTNTTGFSANSLDVLRLLPVASAVDYAYIKGAATGGGGNRVTYGADGSDTDVSIDFIAKGAGNINFNAQGSNAGAIARFQSFGVGNANGVLLTSAAAGSGPTISSQNLGGTGDTNIDLNILAVGTGKVAANNDIKTGAVAVASLPTCNAARKGARYFVTDSNTVVFHATIAAGGANNVGVTCDGTNWYVS